MDAPNTELPESQTQAAPTPRAHGLARLLVFVCLLLALVALDATFGGRLEQQSQAALSERFSWPQIHYRSKADELALPVKRGRRILYISNSHALTGGEVAKHLSALLNRVCPGAGEETDILDLSSGGMFAPEFLQRYAGASAWSPDLLILPVAYISFSDRMRLAMQSPSAVRMWKPQVRARLPASFWLRNYDLGLYLDAAAAQVSHLIAHRNRFRESWTNPVQATLAEQHISRPALFLDADVHQRWRFPEGFDNNLFQWRLYASGRASHMRDLADLLRLANEDGVPVLGANLPIHWAKEPGPTDADDISTYRQQLAQTFAETAGYTDYQSSFPYAFSTYDALHPTWHGARLHALDLVVRMRSADLLGCAADDAAILGAFQQLADEDAPRFREALRQTSGKLTTGFRRFDFTEAANATELLTRLTQHQPGSSASHKLLRSFAVRIRYWLETKFESPASSAWSSGIRGRALTMEVNAARTRVASFRSAVGSLAQKMLHSFPLPAVASPESTTESILFAGGPRARIESWQTANGDRVQRTSVAGRTFSWLVVRSSGAAYERVDVLGDGSFAELHVNPRTVHVPPWLINREPVVTVGI